MADQDPNRDHQDPNVEEPGDTDSADIVGRTGEQMPVQSHDGIESEEHERSMRVNDDGPDDVPGDSRLDNPRVGPVSDPATSDW